VQKDEDSKMLGDQIEALSTKFEGRLHLGENAAPSVAEIKMGSKKAAGDRYVIAILRWFLNSSRQTWRPFINRSVIA